MSEQTTVPAQPQPQFERGEDFTSLYANNVQFEPSSWDLKLIFGELDQSGGKVTIEQHTSITLSWVQAKVMSYFLQANIAAYESVNGKIKILSDVVPPEPSPLPQELENNPQAKAVAESIRKIHQEFIASL
jgi:hypothetical protein